MRLIADVWSQARYLCLGLGGGALPMFLEHYLGRNDEMQLSAVELDPAVPEAARQCMGLDLDFGHRKAGTWPIHLSSPVARILTTI